MSASSLHHFASGVWMELRAKIRAARRRGALWVRMLDTGRLTATAGGRGILWTRLMHRNRVHQTTTYTCEDRYPDLFDLAAKLAPDARRILSFGCSTGEELVALRQRFPGAEIVGAEINPRCRRIAARRVASDPATAVSHPGQVQGPFDLVFAMAVLQREPARIAQLGVTDLSAHYPFHRFDAAVGELAGMLDSGGLLCVQHAQYRIEDSSIAGQFEPIAAAPEIEPPLFGPDGRLMEQPSGRTIFRKTAPGRAARQG